MKSPVKAKEYIFFSLTISIIQYYAVHYHICLSPSHFSPPFFLPQSPLPPSPPPPPPPRGCLPP